MDSLDIAIDHVQNLVRVTAVGDIYQADGEKIITTARQTAAQYGYDVLYDVRRSNPKVPLARWFHLPRELTVFKEATTRNIRAAILITQNSDVETFEFYELVTQNVGLKVKIFFSEDDALDWLKKKPGPDQPA